MIDFGNAKKYIGHQHEIRWSTYGKYCMDSVSVDGLWLEFGVASGATSTEIIKNLPSENDVLYGFDWFKGLPEKWANHPAGEIFGQEEFGVPPNVDKLLIVNGLFEDTLPEFVDKDFKIAFMHIDCDLYSSTKTILHYTKSKLINGTVIMFDEYYNYDGYHLHEYKAWNEFVEAYGIKYEWIACTTTPGCQACCVITEVN